MYHVDNEKWGKRNNREKRTAKLGKNQNSQRKRKLQILGNIGSRHYQTSRDERKSKNRVPQKNKKTSWNQALQQKSHQRNKHLGSSPCKIQWTIFKIVKEGTQTNRPKKIDVDTQGLTPERSYRLYISRKGRRRLTSIENYVDTMIQEL